MEASLITFQQRLLHPWLVGFSPEQTLHDFDTIPANQAIRGIALLPYQPGDDYAYLLRLLHHIARGTTIILLPSEHDVTCCQTLLQEHVLDHVPQGAILIPTGGSGGRLRFAIHTWQTIVTAIQGYRQFWNTNRIHAANLLPLYHVGGLIPCLRTFVTEGQLLLADWKRVSQGSFPQLPHRDYHLSIVPTQLHRLLELPSGISWLSSFSAVLIGGGPADHQLLSKASAQGIRITPAYGMTEAAGTIALGHPDEFASSHLVQASPLPHWSIHLSDDQEICLQGNALCLGYFPGNAFSDTCFPTGDNGLLGLDGKLQVTGRRDRLIITGGRKADPSLIEDALRQTHLCRAAWVCGLDDPAWGQRIAALLEGTAIPDDKLHSVLRQHLPSWMLPRHVRWTQALPRNPLGKIDKTACLHMLTASSSTC